MMIIVMEVEFHLSGCRTLKDKRHRLSGIRDRFGKESSVAVCESALHDLHQKAQWSFVVIGMDRKQVTQTMDRIELFLRNSVDAEMTRVEHQEL